MLSLSQGCNEVMYHPSVCLPSVSLSLFHSGRSSAWPSQQ
ncbi:STOX2 isoform 5, partial [Pan troglodytes]